MAVIWTICRSAAEGCVGEAKAGDPRAVSATKPSAKDWIDRRLMECIIFGSLLPFALSAKPLQ
jgi:hypothetical protein